MVKSAGTAPQDPYGVQLDSLEIDSEPVGPPQLVLLGARWRTTEPRLVNPRLLVRAVISLRV